MLLDRLGIGLRLDHHVIDLLRRILEFFLVFLELAALLGKFQILLTQLLVVRCDGSERLLCRTHVLLIRFVELCKVLHVVSDGID